MPAGGGRLRPGFSHRLLRHRGSIEQPGGGARRIGLAADDAFEQFAGLGCILRDPLLELAPQSRRGQPEHLGAEVAGTALLQRPDLLDVGAMGVHRLEQLRDPGPLRATALMIGTFQSPLGPSESAVRTSRTIVSVSGCSALLTTITSGISMTPALSAWIESPDPGISARTTVSAWSTMSISACPTPTVSSRTSSKPAASMTQRRLQRRLREAAERAAAGHRADEDALIEKVLRKPDPVAEQGAPRERARGVDREDRDPAVATREGP